MFGRAKPRHYERAAERMAASSRVRVEADGAACAGSLRDISLHGCSLECATAPLPGALVTLCFSERSSLSATVMWAGDGAFGCKFVRPISDDIIEAITT